MSRCFYFSILTAILPMVLAMAGCSPSPAGSDLDPKEKKHLLHVVELAREYAETTKKHPASIAEVKDWAVKEGKATDDDFNSTRDKQPYGLSSGGMGGILVFEQTGKKGKCYMYMMGAIHEQDQDQVEGLSKRMGGRAKGMPRTKK